MIKNLEKLRKFTDDSMFWQTFVYEDVKLISDKHIKILKEEEKQEGETHYLLK